MLECVSLQRISLYIFTSVCIGAFLRRIFPSICCDLWFSRVFLRNPGKTREMSGYLGKSREDREFPKTRVLASSGREFPNPVPVPENRDPAHACL